MKLRVTRNDHTVISLVAIIFVLGLIAINALWPQAFAVCIAIGGVAGAMVVIYEVRLTKRIAQAEFIRDLQSGFSSDDNIGALWRKLLLNEDVLGSDRPLVSSYLTFFETLHLLLSKGVLDFKLTDDLFRNRFFTAIGDEGVLRTALVAQAGSFANVHDLIEQWHGYHLARGIPIHAGYYSYIRALNEAQGYALVELGESDLPDLLELQDDVASSLSHDAWLRINTKQMLLSCLAEQTVLGFRHEGLLVAAAILYDAGQTDENIRRYIPRLDQDPSTSINLKLVLTRAEHRKAGLGRTLVELLEQRAARSNKAEILCTIHRRNTASRALFSGLGYRRVRSVTTPYGKRDVYVRALPSLQKRWARGSVTPA